jgi:plasmid stabilization system protein ParE
VRVSGIQFEGTPAELAASDEVQELLRAFQSRTDVAEGDDEDEPVVAVQAAGEMPDDLRNYIAVRTGTRAAADVVQRWVAEVLAWGTTEAEIGTSRTSSDGLNNYIRLYKRGPRHFGAFAYVTPGSRKVNFRLLRKHAEGFEHVTFRKREARHRLRGRREAVVRGGVRGGPETARRWRLRASHERTVRG